MHMAKIFAVLFALILSSSLNAQDRMTLETVVFGKAKNNHANDILIGPVDGEVTIRIPANKTGRLQRVKASVRIITTDFVAFQLYKADGKTLETDVIVAKGSEENTWRKKVTTIYVPTPKPYYWKWSDTDSKYEGNPVDIDRVPFQRRKADDATVKAYLILSSQKLFTELERAVASNNATAISNSLEHSQDIRKYLATKKFGQEFDDLFNIKPAVGRMRAANRKIDEIVLAIKELKEEKAVKLRAIDEVYRMEVASHIVWGMLDDFRTLKDDVTSSVIRRGNQALAVADEAGKLEAGKKRELEEAVDSYWKEYDILLQQVELLWKAHGPSANLEVGHELNKQTKKLATASPEDVLVWIGKRSEAIQGMPDLNTLAIESRNYLGLVGLPESEKVRKTNVLMLRQYAERLLARAIMVPDEPVFDRDCAAILHEAALMVHYSVSHACDYRKPGSAGPRCWNATYDPYADHGLRMADAALRLLGPGGDTDGVVRSTRLWLKLQRGLMDNVSADLAAIHEMRSNDAHFQLNVARAYSILGIRVFQSDPDEATKDAVKLSFPKRSGEHLQKAFALGFTNLDAINRDEDFSCYRHHNKVPKQVNDVERIVPAYPVRDGSESNSK
jgi:hypothetical protein